MHLYVSYVQEAQDQLATIWLKPSDRDAVRQASVKIDNQLRTQPQSAGEEMGEYRRLEITPLEILFTVSVDDCLVQVWQVA